MKSPTFALLLACLLIFTATALAAPPFDVKLYGFVKGDMLYGSHGVLSFGKAGLSGPQLADTTTNSVIGFTSQHTRFGMQGWTTENSALEVGGKIELDLFTGAGLDNNAKPRLRLAYAWLATKVFEVRAGQMWDLFSPKNPTMDNLGSNLWYSGNVGLRRGQVQFVFYVPEQTTAPIIQLAACEASKEVEGLGPDNLSGMPMLQGRASVEFNKKYQLGTYFVYAKYDPSQSVEDDEYYTQGFGGDFELRFNKYLEVRGEVNSGRNLANANLLTIAGAGNKADTRKSLGIWANAVTKPFKHFNFSIGGGIDKNETDKIAVNAVKQNVIIFGDFIFPIAYGLTFEAEISSLNTKYEGRGDQAAMLYGLGTKLAF